MVVLCSCSLLACLCCNQHRRLLYCSCLDNNGPVWLQLVGLPVQHRPAHLPTLQQCVDNSGPVVQPQLDVAACVCIYQQGCLF
jgi:hypothetical protein